MADDETKVVRRQDDTHRSSNGAREPLPHDVLRELVSSTVWQERAQVALEFDLPVDLVAVLVHDEEIAVRHITYDLHQDISTELLDEAIGLHPEGAPRIAFQVHAPLAALRLKAFNFASPADIER